MDEAYSYFISTRPLNEILFNKIDNHPPAFYTLQHLWTAIDPDPGVIRVPAAVIGSLTIAIIILATSDLFSRVAALAAGALLAASTGHIYFSQDARMYSLLTLGLALASWGLIGLADYNDKKYYATLYLIGATIACYSHVVALLYLGILNGLTFASIWLTADDGGRQFYRAWLLVNLLLLAASLPWLLSLGDAVNRFVGLNPTSSFLTHWCFRNLVGFPGLPLPIKLFADAFILLVYTFGAAFVWRSGRRTLALVSIGMLVLYPTALALLNFATPILANRVFIPCVIPASILFGAAVASFGRRVAQIALLMIVLSIAAWSDVEANKLEAKAEDMPQVLALVDAHGFSEAPMLTCHVLTAATAHLYAPRKAVYFAVKNGTVRFDDSLVKALSRPAAELGERFKLTVDPASEWSSAQQIAFMSTGCDKIELGSEEKLLTSLGFQKVAAPTFKRSKRVVIESMWSELSLWARLPSRRRHE
jgi:hypothetical protein